MLSLDVRRFPIAAFGSILGTGGVALASLAYLPELALLLTYLLTALFLLFNALLAFKAIRHPGVVKAELRHPLPGNFYALQPISAVILAMLYRKVFPSQVDVALLIYGGALILTLSVYLPYHFFSNMNIQFSELHGGWFITPVATILVTNAILLYPVSELTLIVSLLFFGIGATLFLLVLSVLFFRLLSHSLPPTELAPTNYIMLAPIGILIADVLQISSSAGPILGTDFVPLATLVGVGLWGFGIWAILVNLLLLGRYVRGGFPFHIGWWSYVFPTAAYTLGTVSLSKYLGPFGLLSSILYLCLVAIWTTVSLGSLRHWLKSLRRPDESMAPATSRVPAAALPNRNGPASMLEGKTGRAPRSRALRLSRARQMEVWDSRI